MKKRCGMEPYSPCRKAQPVISSTDGSTLGPAVGGGKGPSIKSWLGPQILAVLLKHCGQSGESMWSVLEKKEIYGGKDFQLSGNSVTWLRERTSVTCHVITQCYLPPDRADTPAFTSTEAGTRLSDPGGMQGWVDLGTAVKVRSVVNYYTRLTASFPEEPG